MSFTAVQPLSIEEWNRKAENGWQATANDEVSIWTVMTQIRVALRDIDIKISHGVPSRKLMADEMDAIRLVDIRKHVETRQSAVRLSVNGKPLWLRLHWLEQTTGLFGSASGREASKRQLLSMNEMHEVQLAEALGERPIPKERMADRGGSCWHMYLTCPRCDRRCKVIYSIPGKNDWQCPKCCKPTSLSTRWPHHGGASPNGPDERLFRKHSEAAARFAVKLLRATKVNQTGLQQPARALYENPGLSNKRYTACCLFIDAHRVIAETAYMRISLRKVDAIAPGCLGSLKGEWVKDMELAIAKARLDLQRYRWVLRHANSLRRGRTSTGIPVGTLDVATMHTQGDATRMEA